MAFRAKPKPAAAPAPASPAGPTAAEQHVAALERCIDLRAKLDANVAEELAWPGEKLDAEIVQLVSARQHAAEHLARTGELPAKGSRARTFKDIIEERRHIERAIEIQNQECEEARLAAAAERFVERQADVAKVGRRMALALIEQDRSMRERDALVREIGLPAGTLPFEAWPFAGRLRNTGSQLYRFLEMAVEQGWITPKELNDELEAATAANP